MENYEEVIRPALARLCGYTYGEGYQVWYDPEGMSCYPSDLPDPLNNPADAWALQKTLIEKGCKVELYRHLVGVACDLFPLYRVMIHTREDTPEAALVACAWQAAQETDEKTTG